MLSAKNLNAIEEAKFSFIVGSRISKAPYDLAAHFERHGNSLDDGQVLESARVLGTGQAARTRRVVYQYRFDRHKHDEIFSGCVWSQFSTLPRLCRPPAPTASVPAGRSSIFYLAAPVWCGIVLGHPSLPRRR